MAKKPKRPVKAKPPARRRGRPSRRQASHAALEGVDTTSVDPKAVLRAVAADESAPASARVAAAKALLKDADGEPGKAGQSAERDPIARRALRILQGGKRS